MFESTKDKNALQKKTFNTFHRPRQRYTVILYLIKDKRFWAGSSLIMLSSEDSSSCPLISLPASFWVTGSCVFSGLKGGGGCPEQVTSPSHGHTEANETPFTLSTPGESLELSDGGIVHRDTSDPWSNHDLIMRSNRAVGTGGFSRNGCQQGVLGGWQLDCCWRRVWVGLEDGWI